MWIVLDVNHRQLLGKGTEVLGLLCHHVPVIVIHLQRTMLFWCFKHMALKQPGSVCLCCLVVGLNHSLWIILGDGKEPGLSSWLSPRMETRAREEG
jgi:hypothetical protein